MAGVKGRAATGRDARRTDRTHGHRFGLIDAESGNMVGSFPSEREALRAVAQTARRHGAASDAVLSLSLFRWDTPPDRGFIAEGHELVLRALAAAEQITELPT